MTRAVGIPLKTAAGQLQRSFPRVGIQPLPQPYKPGRVTAEWVGITETDPLVFYVIGDHGGIKAPAPQNAVSVAMQRAAVKDKPAFVYSVGDVVYFNGDASEYGPQFYEPYAMLGVPIIAIPGNHDGDTTDDPNRAPLDTFMANFCSASPTIPAADPQFEYSRHTQTQPSHDWVLALQAVTIIGLYSNVPSGGHFEPEQIAWLTAQLQAADQKPLIVTLHHPPLSVDAHHGGSRHMGDALDSAFAASGRIPDVVLAGHVHDFQRFSRVLAGKTIAYLVQGNSGYHNRHQLASDATPGMDLGNGVTFEYGDASHWGFLKVTVAGGVVHGEYVGVLPGLAPDGQDAQVFAGLDHF